MPSEERQQPTKMVPTPVFTICLQGETVTYNTCSMSFLALPFPYAATTPTMPEKGKPLTLNSYFTGCQFVAFRSYLQVLLL